MTRRKASRARLRPFRLDDAAGVCRIYANFFVDNAVQFGRGRMTVAVADDRVAGFVLWGPAFEPAWFDPGVKRWAELNELHVHPDHYGRGLGTRLVRSAVHQARDDGFAVMYVVTEDVNAPAGKVYEKNGFREHNRIVRYKIEL